VFFFFFQAEDGIRDFHVTGVQTCALPICLAYDGANNIVRKNDDTFTYDGLNQLLFANLKGKFEVDGKAEVQKVGRVLFDYTRDEIGRASCREKCRSRWSQ